MPHTAGRAFNNDHTVKGYGFKSSSRIKSADLVNEEFLGKLRSSMQDFHNSSTIAEVSFIEDVLKNTFVKLQSILRENIDKNRDSIPIVEYSVVKYAKDWISRLFLETEKLGLHWIEPYVTANSDGEIVFEWWYNTRKLTIYIGNQSAEYVQVWGKTVDSLITDGDAEAINVCRILWIWLVS